MAHVHVRSKHEPKHEAWVPEEWLERWPDDYQLINPRKPERVDPTTGGIPVQGQAFEQF